jgi:uncharacterized damage-inducible protein DinB
MHSIKVKENIIKEDPGYENRILSKESIMDLTQFFSHWNQVRADLLSTIDQFSDSDLTYVPFNQSWSVGQIALHIAEAEDGWFRYAVTRELGAFPEYRLDDYPTKEDIKAVLAAVHARIWQYIELSNNDDPGRVIEVPWGESIPFLWIIWHVVEHEIHHRGELSLILGLLGREGLDV